jgi:hypothetical protein
MPDSTYGAKKKKAMTKALSDRIFNRIDQQFLSEKYYLSDSIFRKIALEEWETAPTEWKLHANFSASNKWIGKFRKDYEINLRTPHLRRRQIPDKFSIENYLNCLDNAKKSHLKPVIVNADETSWRMIMADSKIWVQKSKQSYKNQDFVAMINGNIKQSYTVIFSITFSGTKLPFFIIAKGKTANCTNKFHVQSPNAITFSEKGWNTGSCMILFLEFLRSSMESLSLVKKRQSIFLILDKHRSHETNEVLKRAKELKIDLLFIPEGQTSDLQPLDVRIFGELKKIASSEWEAEYLKDIKKNISFEQSVSILQKSWDQIQTTDVRKAWQKVRHNAFDLLEEEYIPDSDDDLLQTDTRSF